MGVPATKNLVLISSLNLDDLAPKPCHVRRHLGQVIVPARPKYKTFGPDLEKLSDPIGSTGLQSGPK